MSRGQNTRVSVCPVASLSLVSTVIDLHAYDDKAMLGRALCSTKARRGLLGAFGHLHPPQVRPRSSLSHMPKGSTLPQQTRPFSSGILPLFTGAVPYAEHPLHAWLQRRLEAGKWLEYRTVYRPRLLLTRAPMSSNDRKRCRIPQTLRYPTIAVHTCPRAARLSSATPTISSRHPARSSRPTHSGT